MRQLLTIASIVGLLSGVVSQAPSDTTALRQLYERHRWFELREAVAGKTVSALYSGAVASAFNRTADAERLLNRAVRESSTTEVANEAREALGRGQPFRCSISASGVRLPVVVNGHAVEWLFDSAFSHSALSESEARMLGISVRSATATAEDFAGGTTSTRTAVADRMAIGDAEVRNVPVLVFPDNQPPWNEQARGKRGTIGLPVVLALQGIRWTRDGTCQVGSNPIRFGGFDGVLRPATCSSNPSATSCTMETSVWTC